LIAVGAFLIAEAIASHAYRVAWSGNYGWHRVLAITGAGAIVAGAIRLWPTRSAGPSQQDIARFGRRWAPFMVTLLVYFVAFLIMHPRSLGDQPHYELESVGLAYDQTRDMTANYARPERYRLSFPFGVQDYHAYHYTRGGQLVLVSNVGLPLLLVPAVPWVQEARHLSPGKELWPWNGEIILIAALSAQLLFRILRRLRPRHPALAIGVWASVVFSAPMVVYASQVYPEGPAVLLALVAADALMRPPTRRTIVIGGVACAAMPWLHVRLLPIAAVLVLGLAIRAFADGVGEQRRTATGVRSAAWAVVPLLVSLVLMGIAFQHWYGSPSPDAQYRLAQTHQPHTLSASRTALAGGLWGVNHGWLPYAPVCILALAGIGYTIRRCGRWALFGLVVAGAYLLNLTIQGSNPAFSFAGRYELVLMPFAAIPLLIATTDLARVRWLLWPLAAFTFYLALAIVFQPPLTVAEVPGITGSHHPSQLWSWFVHIWPEILPRTEQPSPRHSYPGAGSVLVWTSVLLVVSVVGYFVLPRATPRSRSD
jgi:hypothetical protein